MTTPKLLLASSSPYRKALLEQAGFQFEVIKSSFDEDEFSIVGFKDSEREKGLVIWICEVKKGIEFDVVPIGSNEERKELFKKADQYIGKLLTVQFLGLTDDGKPKIAKGKDIRENY